MEKQLIQSIIEVVVVFDMFLAYGEDFRIPLALQNNPLIKQSVEKGIIKQIEKENYFTLKIYDDDRDKLKVLIILFIEKLISSNNQHNSENLPDADVAQIVFDICTVNFKFDDGYYGGFNESQAFDSLQNKVEFKGKDEEVSKLLTDLREKVSLAQVEYNQIMQISKEAQSISKEAQSISEEANEKIREIQSVKGQIYSEFIAILGIFSALIFGLFAGFEGIKGVLSLFKDSDNFGTIAMYCGVVTFMIVTLTFALIQLTGRLIGKAPKSCGCKDGNCECKWYERYRIYTICGGVSLGMIICGILYDIYKIKGLICGIIVLGCIIFFNNHRAKLKLKWNQRKLEYKLARNQRKLEHKLARNQRKLARNQRKLSKYK